MPSPPTAAGDKQSKRAQGNSRRIVLPEIFFALKCEPLKEGIIYEYSISGLDNTIECYIVAITYTYLRTH